MSTDDGENRWRQLAEVAEKERDPEKLYAIVQELCISLFASVLVESLPLCDTHGSAKNGARIISICAVAGDQK
jgi:hypothetical protein